jgi:hypothetical protein
MDKTKEVAEGLVALCRGGRFLDAVNRYYSPDIVSVEAMELPGLGREQRGIEAVRGKNVWWVENHEVHDSKVNGPYLGTGPAANQFAVHFVTDVTPKATGKRNTLSEVGLYTVSGDKVVREEFFYPGS